MKKLIIATVLLAFSFTAISQDKGYFGLEFGAAIPNNDYSSTDTSNNSAGYAVTGYHIGISGTYQFNKNWGLAYSWRRQKNGVDAQTLADQGAAQIPEATISVETKSYFLNGFMIGGFLTIPLTEKLHWDTKLMVGLMTATKPSINFSVSDGLNNIEVEQKEVNSSSFSLGISSGLRLDVAEKLALTFNIESVYANPTYKDIESETKLNGVLMETSKETYSQSINNLNIGLGLVYRFN